MACNTKDLHRTKRINLTGRQWFGMLFDCMIDSKPDMDRFVNVETLG